MSDGVFFTVSKVLWALLTPSTVLVLLVLIGWIALALSWQKLARKLLAIASLILILVSALPLGEWLLLPLERRFPANSALPANADGIIVLGGAIAANSSASWQQSELTEAADRITAFSYLAKLYPAAQLVYSGGNASLGGSTNKETDHAPFLLEQLGIGPERALLFESESRNTWENVVNTQSLLASTGLQTGSGLGDWIVVTSAFHMPRAVGTFCRQNWPVYAYAVDHRTDPDRLWRLQFTPLRNLQQLDLAVHEWLGLFAYRVSRRSDRFFAGINNHCGID